MDSAALLDLLGNENRRRILRLLARRPRYVTEISEDIDVSPKAVIDHLRRLEEAGLVESRVDDRRRKYFHIARDLRLEVNVSPYRFGAKSAYPGRGLDVTRFRHLSIDVESRESADAGTRSDQGRTDDTPADDASADDAPAALARRLDRLTEVEDELSLAQRWVQARLTETVERVGEAVDGDLDERLYASVLLSVQDGAETTEAVASACGVRPTVARRALAALAGAGFLERVDGRWRLAE